MPQPLAALHSVEHSERELPHPCSSRTLLDGPLILDDGGNPGRPRERFHSHRFRTGKLSPALLPEPQGAFLSVDGDTRSRAMVQLSLAAAKYRLSGVKASACTAPGSCHSRSLVRLAVSNRLTRPSDLAPA